MISVGAMIPAAKPWPAWRSATFGSASSGNPRTSVSPRFVSRSPLAATAITPSVMSTIRAATGLFVASRAARARSVTGFCSFSRASRIAVGPDGAAERARTRPVRARPAAPGRESSTPPGRRSPPEPTRARRHGRTRARLRAVRPLRVDDQAGGDDDRDHAHCRAPGSLRRASPASRRARTPDRKKIA